MDNHSNLDIYYQNVRSLCSKTDLCLNLSAIKDFDTIILTETWLSSSILDNELFDESYQVQRHDRDFNAAGRSRGGGVLLAAHSSLSVVPVDVSLTAAVSPLLNILACKCRLSFQSVIIIIAIYISPDLHVSLFEECLNTLEDIVQGTKVVFAGDFNIPHLVNDHVTDSKSDIFRDFCHITNLTQYNKIFNRSGRFLDLVISNLSPQVSHSDDPYFSEELLSSA